MSELAAATIEPGPQPTAQRAVLVTPRDVVVIDRAIATLRAADIMGDEISELSNLRARMAGGR